ncbi:putative N-acetyltransferase camello [Scophthalmus maximus]|uniref:Putative N-acetyltransferase camello n=1 Tax=Scophthalmus maximus TaxID=52904 RepID=A0A2U9C0K6_SCOMX|nr:putative N-acetyltransferase camello [Scophthalmus maximus]
MAGTKWKSLGSVLALSLCDIVRHREPQAGRESRGTFDQKELNGILLSESIQEVAGAGAPNSHPAAVSGLKIFRMCALILLEKANDIELLSSVGEYRPSDRHVVLPLFRDGILEHVYPAFFKAMSHPDHVGVALSISMAGYVLGGSSYFQALLFGGAWAGLIYYCCHDIYEGYVTRRLGTDMADIQANYLQSPDSGFWVAEADVNGQTKVVGMVAVAGRKSEEGAERFDDLNGGLAAGGPESARGAGDGGHGEMPHVVVVFPWRRKSLGSQLMQKALDFCKEHGYARLVLDVSSPQTAAISLCQKSGFVQTASHSDTHANRWVSRLARINVMRMEKFI